ncbi:4-oxalocrotonate tautomerase [Halomonas eurihalina]|uniref:4-oxalocrotonate tautomerase n=1 Tax=Halomonas eurihalina TaxID=42566 RepID=A0A5D9CR07_HALER|nr:MULTISPECIES: 4-oxalocrotonate tautomerase [Halomonas]MBW5799181.1 4-oxalocrotonate tautomerase [Halomonas elongata]MDL4861736.1 4-oxalocrotonate tautomerase [Halomonas elongata]MDR5859087.1 4-oxalocrotonate tautomerase [Halomonas eurihalina]TZG32625.1 4-oxalocrotonate tautomerase [Halomonas eurihalina]
MPRITLTIAGQPDDGLTRKAASELARLTGSVLGKALDATLVMIDYFPKERWFIAGQPLTDWGRNGFCLEVTLTEGTNTRQEKADYHRQAFELLADLIGNVHPHSNIHVLDCRGDAYGYGGVTQEYRYQHPRHLNEGDS